MLKWCISFGILSFFLLIQQTHLFQMPFILSTLKLIPAFFSLSIFLAELSFSRISPFHCCAVFSYIFFYIDCLGGFFGRAFFLATNICWCFGINILSLCVCKRSFSFYSVLSFHLATSIDQNTSTLFAMFIIEHSANVYLFFNRFFPQKW